MPTSLDPLISAERVFIDTNILVYAADQAQGKKRKTARELLLELTQSGRAVISTQVVQEFIAIAQRKLHIEDSKIRKVVDRLSVLTIVESTFDLVRRGFDISLLNKISFWDGMIIVAAREAECSLLLTEDLSHAQILEGVRVWNPFVEG